ncbi:MAG: NADH-quinone oxidoreductase subunit J [Candidatus Pedobacter colombiensis]|uniref:NADH-quinone oxidoreductase subunit J n=1 Tax=Candidatus Pedobacter colombiensis TaxID=3121371 RepID=A0AAJ6B8R2_9SPHI|nr:NADH-quinone oxidoreductase subunit J [Pedobacter sp.]WEK21154.1 MAG: NADH-quinone oxidoreductase subunit J [Pedobacter sp.]
MNIAFYIAAAVTLISTIMVITRHNPVHALLYLVISLLSLSVIFFLLGAHFATLLEVIIYAGAIMVLFIFVIMLLNLGKETAKQEQQWLKPKIWIGPTILSAILFAELFYLIIIAQPSPYNMQAVDAKAVAISLFKPYFIGVELAAMLLMAGVVSAAHIGQHKKTELHRFLKEEEPS